jgi:hypothetical protein
MVQVFFSEEVSISFFKGTIYERKPALLALR